LASPDTKSAFFAAAVQIDWRQSRRIFGACRSAGEQITFGADLIREASFSVGLTFRQSARSFYGIPSPLFTKWDIVVVDKLPRQHFQHIWHWLICFRFLTTD